MNYYEVIPFTNLDYYTYSTELKLEVGQRVMINLRNKMIPALIYKKVEKIPEFKVKEIEFIIDELPLITFKHIKIIEEISKNFAISLGEASKLFFPPISSDMYKLKVVPISPLAPFQKPIFLNEFYKNFKSKSVANKKIRELSKNGIVKLELHIKRTKEKKESFFKLNKSIEEIMKIKISNTAMSVVNYLNMKDIINEKELYELGILKHGTTVLKTLMKKNIICEVNESQIYQYKKIILSDEQQKVVNEINALNDKPHLLYGVTGSGKTEVFFEIAKPLLENGKKILITIPEISLTPQLVNRIKNRFAEYNVSLYHSSLTSSEKLKTWYDSINGKTDIIVGTRSALFIPVKELGMIIMDEEHDTSYYQSEGTIYDGVEAAFIRSKIENIKLVLASATPRVKDYYRAINNEFYMEKIEKRIFSKMPEVEIINMKEEEKISWIFSKKVIKEIKKTLEKDKKIIIFTPTRGYANYIMCPDCGYIFKCSECDVSLTFHKNDMKLKCHYCGKEEKVPSVCPNCGNVNLQSRGYGTERVVNELMKLFPSEVILRVDRTVIRSYEELKKTFNYMKEPGKKIIVGTKMITKGLDIEDLHLVVVLDSDRYSNFPDYSAYESTGALILQVGGRSGRKERGKVLIQTFKPEEELYKAAKNHDYTMILNHEIKERKEFRYPPFSDMIIIMVYEEDKKNCEKISREIFNEVKEITREIMGPVDPIISRIKNKYRKQIILRGNINIESLRNVLKNFRNIKVYVNPPSTLL
ncbi:primosomal protein N' [Tepiditoga spiralis]|uniref:Replication restart protein PriA n=1 Tax=Tepiditoga spiralis TaxID=2108365 RepID=A0A7G1G7G3_9BACT|nr:primosomal protein N' [Tepiditoga spiralis]BBE29962.1 primosomal protein N' [Tepiditoga spiralis]